MKIFTTSLFLLLVLAACQKEYTAEYSTEHPGSGNKTGSFKAKINSVQWSADKAAGASFTTAGNGLPRLLNISGLSNDHKIVTITLVDSGVHRYKFEEGSFQGAAYFDSTLPTAYAYTTVLSGTVEITSINTDTKTLSGTFNFKASSQEDNTQIDITEGAFTDIPYLEGAILPPSIATDTFHVKINDSLFTPYSIAGNALSFNHTIMVQGSDSAALKTVALNLPDNITAGSYSMDDFTYYGLYNNGEQSFSSVSGTLKILEHNTATKRIRGNFDFKAESPIDPTIATGMTEGYFSIKYQ